MNLKSFFSSSVLIAAVSFSASADTVITVSTWGGVNHGVNSIVWPTWGSWIESATEGRVSLEVVHDLGGPGAQMELVADGVADVAWIYPGYTPGRFKLTKVVEFPIFEDYPAEAVSVAYHRTYKRFLESAGEYQGLDVMGVSAHGPGGIYTNEKISNLEELSGKRIRAGGGVMGDVANSLGIAGVALPATGIYEAASQGVIDGTMMTAEGLFTYRIPEVLPYGFTVDGGFYRAGFSIVMNPEVWNRVSEEDRKAIESVSGERLSKLFGYMWDKMDARGYEFSVEQGMEFSRASEEDVSQLRNLANSIIDDWVEEASGNSVNAERALEYFHEQLSEVAGDESISKQLDSF